MSAPCGTAAGWARHRRRGEHCDSCKAAWRVADAAYKRAARALPATRPPCRECGQPRRRQSGARGWCHRCYGRWLKRGDPSVAPSRAVDDMAVERAVFGDRPAKLTTAEREQVVKRLNRLGWSDARIAEHLDIGRSGVQRIRDRRGILAVPVERRTAVAA